MGLIRKGFYAGTFDFFHKGHAAVLTTAVKLFDHVVIGIGVNPLKESINNSEQKKYVIKKFIKNALPWCIDKINIVTYDNPLVSAARQHKCEFIVRGLRNINDFGDEMQLATTNKMIEDVYGIPSPAMLETIWIPKGLEISSTLLKQVILLNDPKWKEIFERYVPNCIYEDLLSTAIKVRTSHELNT